MPRLLSVAFAFSVIFLASSFVGNCGADEPPVSFNRDVRPILSDICFQCHGPDVQKLEADLRLDQREGLLGGDDPIVVPGDPDASRLYQRIMSADPDEVMPPAESKKQLTEQQRANFKKWIEQGAKYEGHWAFEPLRRPEVPAGAGSQPVDAFLNLRLQQLGLITQPEANRETLIRRVAFTLTGFPPTLKEIDDYLADQSPQAYEHMVDRYLAAPQFGEEMARYWLDVARYADTHGLHLDNERQMWAYRDWVVNAFNQNLPYDQFTIWQLAGDLLPTPTTEQLVATGFNRCNVTTSEGGSIAEEFVYRYAVERTTATAQAWLGLTAGCAVCHDHKYDPLTMKEFYSMYAFFNTSADPAMDGNINTTPPFLKLPTAKQSAAAEAANKVEREARAWLDTIAQYATYKDPIDAKDPARKKVREVLFDDSIPIGATSKSSSRNAVAWQTDPPFGAASGRRVIRQAHATGCNDTIDFKLRPLIVPQEAAVEFWLWIAPQDIPQSITLAVAGGQAVTWTKGENGLRREGSTDAVPPGQWTKLSVPATAFGLQPGGSITSVTMSQAGGIACWDELALAGECEPAKDPLESLAVWRKVLNKSVPPEVPVELHAAIQSDPEKPLAEADAKKLLQFYLAVVARPIDEETAEARAAWEAARVSRIVAEDSAPGTFVFGEMSQPRDSFVMLRGQYDKPSDKVEPAVPAVFPQIAKLTPETRLTRLDLAKWLVSAENPLPARVTVNRFWQQVFGTGLVKTSYDFGSQGTPPSHPELLDWLAVEFRDSGWNVKQFVKTLVMSDAFRRQAKITPELLVADPGNRYYARGPRFRLDAEQVRDNVLFVSGLLDPTMGGRGVNPYQPPNIWEPVGYSDSNTRFYLQDHGASLYRRSLYVFLKRTAPPPFMSNFDGPNREQVCTVRERSNTPLQALQLMNDVQHFEAARALAERTLTEGGVSVDERITYLYRSVLSRRPEADELNLVRVAFDRQRELYDSNPDSASQAIRVGESQPKNVASPPETAAWTMIANLILNLDETVNRN